MRQRGPSEVHSGRDSQRILSRLAGERSHYTADRRTRQSLPSQKLLANRNFRVIGQWQLASQRLSGQHFLVSDFLASNLFAGTTRPRKGALLFAAKQSTAHCHPSVSSSFAWLYRFVYILLSESSFGDVEDRTLRLNTDSEHCSVFQHVGFLRTA